MAALKRTAPTPAALLRDLEAVGRDYGRRAARRKLTLLAALERTALARADEVVRLHEILAFLRAYPDDAPMLARVERMLRGFAKRADLVRHRDALESSGIAGTPIRFRFYAPLASWLARRWPQQLAVDWDDFKTQERLVYLLPLLTHFGETPALDEYDMSARQWVRYLKGPGETDASFLIRRFERLRADTFVREKLYDELDIPMILAPAPGTPARTLAKQRVKRVSFNGAPYRVSAPTWLPKHGGRRARFAR